MTIDISPIVRESCYVWTEFWSLNMDREITITVPTVGKVPAEALPTLVAVKPSDAPLCGSVLVMIQFDVCEEIRLDQLRQILGARTADASFKHSAPGYVRFQRPPVEEALEPLVLESGERLQGEIKYFDYGVVSVVFELPFSGDWHKLVQLSSRWVSDTNFESLATRIVKQKLERVRPALVKPYDVNATEWLKEDYFIFHLREIAGSPSATDLLASGDSVRHDPRRSSHAAPTRGLLSAGQQAWPSDRRRWPVLPNRSRGADYARQRGPGLPGGRDCTAQGSAVRSCRAPGDVA